MNALNLLTPELPAPAMLEIWERAVEWHPIDRALLILQFASGATLQCLAELSIGERDALLLQIRRDTFGDRIESCVQCPLCEERLEFSLSCAALLAEGSSHESLPGKIQYEGIEWQLRSPNSRDLAAALALKTRRLQDAAHVLLSRCVSRVDGATPDLAEPWSEMPVAALAEAMSRLDPLAEIRIQQTCEACGHGWSSFFDIVGILWDDLQERCCRLLQEFDLLARRYGWTESAILQLSERRRGIYVQMAAHE